MRLAEKIVALHIALDEAFIPHAFGGALALAWCTQRARATIDIDVNVFVSYHSADKALDAMPEGVTVTAADRIAVASDGQTRLWRDRTRLRKRAEDARVSDQVVAGLHAIRHRHGMSRVVRPGCGGTAHSSTCSSIGGYVGWCRVSDERRFVSRLSQVRSLLGIVWRSLPRKAL